MDNIKNLIAAAHRESVDREHQLAEAHRLLTAVVAKRNMNECFEQATEMCVILAESCLQVGLDGVAHDCVKLYFLLDPCENQYLTRAFIVQSQLIRPDRFADERALDTPIGLILRAIAFSTTDTRLHYLVYNCSLVYYETVRHFLHKDGYRHLCPSLGQVCKALEDIKDSNMEWRAQLMVLLVQCHIDAGHRKEVLHIVDGTATFIGKHSPYLLKDLLTSLVGNGIGTTEKYLWYTRNHIDMQIFMRLLKLKIMRDKDNDGLCVTEALKILGILVDTDDKSDNESTETIIGKPERRTSSSSVPINGKQLSIEQRCTLLLELGKISLQKAMYEVCQRSIDKLQEMTPEKMVPIHQEAQFINSELVMIRSQAGNDRITPTSLKLRLSTIEKCHATLLNVIRSGNNQLIQIGCATLWNLCLPILQPNFRSRIHSNLLLIADSLESIGSLNYKLCAQVHIEVGKGFAALAQTNDALKYFRRALLLDRTGEYKDVIEHFIHKLKMQEKLYEKPTDPCDAARQLLEQLKSTVSTEKIPLEKLRPLLAEIGHCLAPDDFLVVLDHDLSVEQHGNEKTINGKLTKLSSWESIMTRLGSYLKRSGNNQDRTKLNLWIDLVKLSRKLLLWDICRVASCFAVLYDDGRWKNHFQIKPENLSHKEAKSIGSSSNLQTPENSTLTTEATGPEIEGGEQLNDKLSVENKVRKRTESEISNVAVKKNRYEKMLLEQIVEMYFIRAEAFIQAIRNEGAQLFTFPQRPRDLKRHPKGFVKDTSKEDEDWRNYCECLLRLSSSAVNCFLRAATLSIDLQAPWLTKNAATYLWNYSIHVIALGDHPILVPSFQAMFDHLRQMMTEKMVDIITQYGVVLAHGMIQRSMPAPLFTLEDIFETPTLPNSSDKKGKRDKESTKPKGSGIPATGQSHADSVAMSKRALDICQYLMDLTTDHHHPSQTPKVDIETKSRLIEIWVQCKQSLQQSIGRTSGTDDAETKTSQGSVIKAITAVQMLWASLNEYYKFPDLPTIDDCLQMIDECEWTKSSVLLSLLLKLAYVVMKGSGSNPVNALKKITEKAMTICPEIKPKSKTDVKILAEEEKLAISFITFCHGISLHRTSSENTTVLMQCLSLFVKACCYARDANNYSFVSEIAHYFWKVAQCLVERFSNTIQIAGDIEVVISCIASTVDKKRLKMLLEPHSEEESPKIEAELEEKLPLNLQCPEDQKLITVENIKSLFLTTYRRRPSKTIMEQDLKLRIQMHIAVFQSYFFQEKWSEAFKILDGALADLPRTEHRMELFRHRLLTKVRLGQSIELDVQKFKNEAEDKVALLWREVAIRSKTLESQLSSYKNSIQSLRLKENDWLKVDLIMELSQWMFHSNFPLDICSQYVDFAIDILLNTEKPEEKLHTSGSSRKTKSRSFSRKIGSASKSSVKSETPTIPPTDIVDPPNKDITANTKTKRDPIDVTLLRFPSANIEDISDIRVLSGLMVCWTFQSSLRGFHSSKCDESIIMATACVTRMWQVVMGSVASVVKEIAKSKVDSETPTKSKEKKDKKDKNAKVEPEPVKTKVAKRKGPIDWLPTTVEEWSIFEVTDDVLEALSSSTYMPDTGLHDANIKHMGQFLSSCDCLLDLLEEMNYEILSFPLLSLMDAISRSEETATAKLFNQYTHIRALQLSIRLNMQVATTHHHKFIDVPFVLPEYNAQIEVIKSNISEYKGQNKSDILPLNYAAQSAVSLGVNHLMRKERKFGYLHEIWIKMGRKLIELGYNKEASEVICAAEELTDVLKDIEMTSEIKILKAILLKNQGELSEALGYVDDLENSCSQFTLKQWQTITDVLIGVAVDDVSQPHDTRQMRVRLSRLHAHTVERFGEIKLTNQSALSDNLIGRMNYGLLLLDKRLVALELGDHMCWENSNKSFNDFLQRLTEIEVQFEKSGNWEAIIAILGEKIEIVERLIEMADEENSKALMLIKLCIIEKLLNIQSQRFDRVRLVCPPAQEGSFSLPTDRQLARSKLMLVRCLTDIYSYEVKKTLQAHLEHQRKDPLKQIVDEFVAESIPDTETAEWRSATAGICDRICSHLTDTHTLCSSMADINAECLMRLGRVMKLRAMEIYPVDSYQWSHVSTDPPILKPVQTSDSERENTEEDTAITIAKHKKMRKIMKSKKAIAESRSYLNQSIELLCQSVYLSINNHRYDICCEAIELLVDILGQFEANLCSQLLCLYQNCRASMTLRQVLRTTLRRASTGQLAALVLQYNFLVTQSRLKELNLTESPLFRSVVERLTSDFLAWRITNVSLNQTDILKDLTTVTSGFCLLQHSLHNDYLFCAFVDSKQKSLNTTKAATKSPSAEKVKILRMETSAEKVRQLRKEWNQYRSQLDEWVYAVENRHRLQENISNSQRDNEIEILEGVSAKERTTLEANIMESKYSELIWNLQRYLNPIFEKVSNVTVTDSDRGGSNNLKGGREPTPSVKDFPILLVDDILASTPLEAIPQFKHTVSRDFSLQMLHHKFKALTDPETTDPSQNPDPAKKKDKSKVPHRIPALRDTTKKPTKTQPLNRQIPNGTVGIDTHQIRYIVDPFSDTDSLGSMFKKELTGGQSNIRQQQITPRWIGLIGQEDAPSIAEIELYVKDTPMMIYVGTENFTSLLTPQRVSMMNTSELRLLCCFDRMTNRTTKLRLIQKTGKISDEDSQDHDSVTTAQLMSLMGARSMVCNQWSSLTEWNAIQVSKFMSSFLDDGLSLGDSVLRLRTTESQIDGNESDNSDHATFIRCNAVSYGLPNLVIV